MALILRRIAGAAISWGGEYFGRFLYFRRHGAEIVLWNIAPATENHDAKGTAGPEAPRRYGGGCDYGRENRHRRDRRETQRTIWSGPVWQGRGKRTHGKHDSGAAVENCETGRRETVGYMTGRKGFLLLAYAKSPSGSLTPVQAQKIMFVLGQEAPRDVGVDFYQFVPYNYGPFCQDIYDDQRNLDHEGYLRKDGKLYVITKSGLNAATDIEASQRVGIGAYLGKLVQWTTSKSFSALLSSIYSKYPEFAVNSVFNK
jgi:hypothetical protein